MADSLAASFGLLLFGVIVCMSVRVLEMFGSRIELGKKWRRAFVNKGHLNKSI
jgi:hypothetical protein